MLNIGGDSLIRLVIKDIAIDATFESTCLRILLEMFSSQNIPEIWSFDGVSLQLDSCDILRIEKARIGHCRNNNIETLFGWLHMEARYIIMLHTYVSGRETGRERRI